MIALILVIVGMILIILNVKAIKNDEGSFKKELNNSMENLDAYKEEIGLLRKEFAETLLDVQKEVEYLKKEINLLKEDDINKNNLDEKVKVSYKTSDYKKEESIVKKDINENNIKIEEVNSLLKKGHTVDEVAEKLGMGKGEVILIKELYSK